MPATTHGAPCIFGTSDKVVDLIAKTFGVPLPEGVLLHSLTVNVDEVEFARVKLVGHLRADPFAIVKKEWVLMDKEEGIGVMEVEPWPVRYVSPELNAGEKTQHSRIRLNPGEEITWTRDRENNVVGYSIQSADR